MNGETMSKVLRLAEKAGRVFIATADGDSIPHIAVAKRMQPSSGDTVSITEWFCPETISNLSINRNVSLVVWDDTHDEGYQCIGEMKAVIESGMLDGYSPIEERSPVQQILHSLSIKLSAVIPFSLAAHVEKELP